MRLSDEEFLKAFQECTLTHEEWDHPAHIRMGWLYLDKYATWEKALAEVRKDIKKLNSIIGARLGYHETITRVFLVLIQNRRKVDLSWQEFMKLNEDLFEYPPIIFNHYSKELIMSPEAKEAFIEPDLKPLPN